MSGVKKVTLDLGADIWMSPDGGCEDVCVEVHGTWEKQLIYVKKYFLS